MPIRADYAVLLDANVLAEASVTDLYLRLAEEPRLLLPKWTNKIWDEVDRTCLHRLGWKPKLVKERRNVANLYFEEAMISGYEHLESHCTNPVSDRHVLAAAIHAKVGTIVTANLSDFPENSLSPWEIVAVHPGTYLITLFEHDRGVVVDKLHRLAMDRGRTFEETLGRLAWSVGSFSAHVGNALGIEIPKIEASTWKKNRER